jgi:hypothetical protein
MNRNHTEEAGSTLVRRLRRQWHRLLHDDFAAFDCSRRARLESVHKRYGIPKDEARQRVSTWIREPGVLDDWNDTRSILDL